MKTSSDDDGPMPFFHEGMRAWQDRFDSRRLADRLEERLGRNRFTEEDRTVRVHGVRRIAVSRNWPGFLGSLK